MKKLVNGIEIELTQEEITAREERLSAKKLLKEQTEADEIAKKASGRQKLLDLGLTEEEVKALIGI
jgi:hypothetical protein